MPTDDPCQRREGLGVVSKDLFTAGIRLLEVDARGKVPVHLAQLALLFLSASLHEFSPVDGHLGAGRFYCLGIFLIRCL